MIRIDSRVQAGASPFDCRPSTGTAGATRAPYVCRLTCRKKWVDASPRMPGVNGSPNKLLHLLRGWKGGFGRPSSFPATGVKPHAEAREVDLPQSRRSWDP